jgi:hypothetical protein
MSAGEVFSRTWTRGRCELWRRRRSWPETLPLRPPRVGYVLPAECSPDTGREVIQRADELLAGRLSALGQSFPLEDVQWSLDPQSGVRAALDFGPTMDCRNPRLVGNVRNIWELNRHQHLSLAALAFAMTRDERYAEFVERQLLSWLEQNPFPRGVNWASPLELGLRLISWVWIGRLLIGSRQHERLFGQGGRLWPSIYRHQWMIAKMPARGSSANNHLLGEMVGLYVSAQSWDVFTESRAWSQMARRVLHREMVRQYYPSGVNREQAYGYHVFSTQLAMLAALEGERAGVPFTCDYRDRLLRAVTVSADLTATGTTPNYGDCDDSVAVGLGVACGDASRLTEVVVSSWLGGAAPGLEPGPSLRLAAAVLLAGVHSRARLSAIAPPASRSKAFRDAGLFIMGARTEPGEVRCLGDAGELGYLSIAAHGHADALAFSISVDGEPLVVDAGTYSYHYAARAREYFRSTQAHNTITVDGLSQSVAGGPFLWRKKAGVTVSDWQVSASGATLEASHDGYRRLKDPVIHRRVLDLDAAVITVRDCLEGSAAHWVDWRLHFAPQCTVRLTGSECAVVGHEHGLTLTLDPCLEWSLHVGEPSAGWCSPSFNRCQKTTTLIGAASMPLPCDILNLIRVSG